MNTQQQCKICDRSYEAELEKSSAESAELQRENRKKLLDVCGRRLYFDDRGLRSVSPDEKLPFCEECAAAVQEIASCDDNCTNRVKELNDFVDTFVVNALRLRKVSDPRRLPKRIGGRLVKIEVVINEGDIICKICQGIYLQKSIAERQPLTPEVVNQTIQMCEKYLLTEIIDPGCFDLNYITAIKHLPFCSDCCQSIQKLIDLEAILKNIKEDMEDRIDTFTMKALRFRKALKSAMALLGSNDTVGNGNRLHANISSEETEPVPSNSLSKGNLLKTDAKISGGNDIDDQGITLEVTNELSHTDKRRKGAPDIDPLSCTAKKAKPSE